ncbi:hypothetical protein NXW94_30380 [Bacteroides ovatus]|nr:hypothetical protein [Bacteroides ovatus]
MAYLFRKAQGLAGQGNRPSSKSMPLTGKAMEERNCRISHIKE